MNERMPFVYLSSSPYSGSTLFSFLVNTHPQVATVGEMTGLVTSEDPDTYQCSCGQQIRKCDFWRQVTEQMALRQFAFDPGFFDTRIELGDSQFAKRILNTSFKSRTLEALRDRMLVFWPRQRQRLDYLVARNKALAASVLQVTGKAVFFDASKTPTVIRHLYREPDINLRAVHLVRDVRGASLSRRKNQGETNWNRVVKAWVRANRNIERQLERLPPDKWIRIRYEDLCTAPSETLARFFEFCGLAAHNILGDFHSVEHHIVGNRMRLTRVGQVRLDEGWRSALTFGEQTCAAALVGTMHARYGYPRMSAADLTT